MVSVGLLRPPIWPCMGMASMPITGLWFLMSLLVLFDACEVHNSTARNFGRGCVAGSWYLWACPGPPFGPAWASCQSLSWAPGPAACSVGPSCAAAAGAAGCAGPGPEGPSGGPCRAGRPWVPPGPMGAAGGPAAWLDASMPAAGWSDAVCEGGEREITQSLCHTCQP